MTNLSDIQRILLSNATRHPNGSLLPLPDTLKPGGGAAKAIVALIRNGFADERATTDAVAIRRSEGDIDYGVFVTLAGGAAIGVDLGEDGTAEVPGPIAPAPTLAPVPPRAASKSAAIIALLARTEGATLLELIEATDWLPHTTRAALTGLRKKGHAITRGKRDGVTCYRIVEAA